MASVNPLVDFYHHATKENAETDLMAEIRHLEQRIKILKNRGERLKNDLESGHLGPMADYYTEEKEPDLARALSWRPNTKKRRTETEKLTEENLKKIVERFNNAPNVEHGILLDGVIQIQDPSRSERITYQFHPEAYGRFHGPYSVTLLKRDPPQSGFVLVNADLPFSHKLLNLSELIKDLAKEEPQFGVPDFLKQFKM